MEEKNDLMKNIANDSNNMKKYLIIAGLVFVIFVIGIVVAKFAFGSSNDNTQVILPPEPTTKTQKSDTDLFNSIPVEQTDNVDNTKPKVEKKEQIEQKMNSDVESQPIQDNETEFKKPEPTKSVKPEVEQIPTQSVEPVKTMKPEVKQVQPQNVAPVEPKKVVEKVSKPKVESKPAQIKKKIFSPKAGKAVRIYYIQVAAVTRGEPSKRFLKLIKENGYNYKVSEIEIKGQKIKRVLVGPFTKDEAQKEISKVKAKITASAFIKKLK